MSSEYVSFFEPYHLKIQFIFFCWGILFSHFSGSSYLYLTLFKHFLYSWMSVISHVLQHILLGLYWLQLLVNEAEEMTAIQDLLSALRILQPVTTQAEVQVDMKLWPTQNQRMRKEGRGHTPYHQSGSSWQGCHLLQYH